jgi:hypothetical protein
LKTRKSKERLSTGFEVFAEKTSQKSSKTIFSLDPQSALSCGQFENNSTQKFFSSENQVFQKPGLGRSKDANRCHILIQHTRLTIVH